LGEGWALEMEASHNTIKAFAFVVLDETDGGYLFVKLSLREGFEEIASCVFEYAGLYDDYAINSGFDYVHD
jgi:hypothetical protein